MIVLQGKYNNAKIFADTVDDQAISQILHLLNQGYVSGSQIRIMPDVHAGSGCTIGTTITMGDRIDPRLVGSDIGCGMETIRFEGVLADFKAVDTAVRGALTKKGSSEKSNHYESLHCIRAIKKDEVEASTGTLGGGNHFIEIARDESGELYLIVHSGSRKLGAQVSKYYYDKIDSQEGVLAGGILEQYLEDMKIVQYHADFNRKLIAEKIMKALSLKSVEQFMTVHNYIDTEAKVLRKGAISAQVGEKILIPMNMRDGSLIGIGKGNEDWNFSAPHGAGRLMSRSDIKSIITLGEYQESMKGIFSSTISENTVDESPFAYKPMAEIVDKIGETAEIINRLAPLYNFKSSS